MKSNNLTIKFLITLISSSIISFAIFSYIKTDFKDRNDYRVNYDHISREYNMNYEILKGLVNDYDLAEQFKYFVNRLDDSLRYNTSSCKKLVQGSKVPQIVTKLDVNRFSIQIIHEDKNLIVKCTNFIDKQVQNNYLDNLQIPLKIHLQIN